MKIVINTCYGGFGLNNFGIIEYFKRKRLDVFFYTQTKFEFKDGKNEYEKKEDGEYCVLKDCGDVCENLSVYYTFYETDRTDKDLIAIVEIFGNKVNHRCASLKVVEIPDDVKWEIDEHDGIETIKEVCRSWS